MKGVLSKARIRLFRRRRELLDGPSSVLEVSAVHALVDPSSLKKETILSNELNPPSPPFAISSLPPLLSSTPITTQSTYSPVAILVCNPNLGSSSFAFGVECLQILTVLSVEHEARIGSVGDQVTCHARSVWPERNVVKRTRKEREEEGGREGEGGKVSLKGERWAE